MGLWCTCYQVGGIARHLVLHVAPRSLRLARRVLRARVCIAAVGLSFSCTLQARGQTSSPHRDRRAGLDWARPASCCEIRCSGATASPTSSSSSSATACSSGSLITCIRRSGSTKDGRVSCPRRSKSAAIVGAVISIGLISDRLPHLSAIGHGRFGARRPRGRTDALCVLGRHGTLDQFSLMALIGALLFGPDSLVSGAAAQDAGGRAPPRPPPGW